MKPILDACCGSRMFWFDKENPAVIFMDHRVLDTKLCDGRRFIIHPDVVGDFRDMPFKNASFRLIVFDPPHLRRAGEKSWLRSKYGLLGDSWQDDLHRGFEECMRVLQDYGVLVFKWSEDQITTGDVLKLFPEQPLFGNRRGKTVWLVFMKVP